MMTAKKLLIISLMSLCLSFIFNTLNPLLDNVLGPIKTILFGTGVLSGIFMFLAVFTLHRVIKARLSLPQSINKLLPFLIILYSLVIIIYFLTMLDTLGIFEVVDFS